jgi:sulfur-oxidizing protein SoxA
MDRRQRVRRDAIGFHYGRLRLFALFIAVPICLFSTWLAAGEIPRAERRSGYELMSRETRAMQDDEATGPAAFSLLDGEALWNRKEGPAGASCASCHGAGSMKGVAARYPKVKSGRLVNLEQQINVCRTERQKAAAWAYESRELLALAAFVGRQSRGMPIDIKSDAATAPFLAAGRASFNRKQGQLNLSCAQCHDDNWGKRLAGSVIPQGHPTGYPIYRLEWEGVGSLERRLRGCLYGIRAESTSYGARELVELELFLMWRANGMRLETPAVRP